MDPSRPPLTTNAAGTSLPVSVQFIALMSAWTALLLAVIRMPWFESTAIAALVSVQRTLAEWYGSVGTTMVTIGSSCSGADQMALSVGVTLAYPARWSRRLLGAAGGIAVVVVLNTVRLATLLSTAGTPRVFNALHLYVWPALLMGAVLGYVLVWIRWSDSRIPWPVSAVQRFGFLAGALLVGYAGAVPWALSSAFLQDASAWTAMAGEALLSFTGTVRSHDSMLITARGAYLVTPECLFTPLIPLYLAAATTLPAHRSGRAAALALAAPLFFLLGVFRLLVLAAPPQVLGEPLVAVHGFFQVALAAILVVLVSVAGARSGGRPALRTSAVSLAGAVAMAAMAAPWWGGLLVSTAAASRAFAPHAATVLRGPEDVQGALALLPLYEVALLTGLWLALPGAKRLLRAAGLLAMLFTTQVLTLIVLGEFEAHAGIGVSALAIRGWAVVVPLLLAYPRRQRQKDTAGAPASYRGFWNDMGGRFPSLAGAPSTRYYMASEVRLLTEQLPDIGNCTLLKTDLWDEAKNTRILRWAADQGARVFGIDISAPIVDQARAAFARRPLRAGLADVRDLPFADGSFDAVYSMGTIEHFPESEAAVRELARVLRPGGRLILGVPNRHDPFLRPLLVWLLQRAGAYAYGDERAFSRRELRAMLKRAGLDVVEESGILFMPGWLRMLDLWCHTVVPPLTLLTGPVVALFQALDEKFPALRRHGYLLASVGIKPARPETGPPTWRQQQPRRRSNAPLTPGREYVVDAYGCNEAALRSRPTLERLVGRIVADMRLHVVEAPLWHAFPDAGGVTGLVMLAESHVSVHTFPEFAYAALNVYCCRETSEWDWEAGLGEMLGARIVLVRSLARGANPHPGVEPPGGGEGGRAG